MKTCLRCFGWILVSTLLGSALSSTFAGVVLPANATWKYLGNGTDPGTVWQRFGFNDSSWLAGPAQLGYGDGDEATVVTTVSPRPITVYFRHQLVLPAGMSDATVRLLRDDGAVVYVNGVEVLRNNMPGGPVNYNTLAVAVIGGSDETTFIESPISTAPFVAGTNVIAVEIHQNSASSSDMSFALELLANFGSPWPVVTVEALRSETREVSPFVDIPEVPAVFRLNRTGPTNGQLGVNYRMSGTASNGVDYDLLSGLVTIPAGASNATVEVWVKDDLLVEGTETVVLTVIPTPCMECYVVGNPGSATAYILDDDHSNAPPTVWISRPRENESFTGPTNVLLRAVAQDPEDGYGIQVEFFNGPNKIGDATFLPTMCPAADCPSWDLVWSNVPPGNYTLTARATDKNGATAVSAPVHFSVVSEPPVTPRVLVAKGSVWKYLDDGSDQGTAWREPAFNDAAWAQGPAQLGYGDGDEATTLRPDPDNDGAKSITYYFRRAFNVPDADAISNLVLYLLRDDGAVVYLNGVEVFRSNMPDGPITYQTLAIENVQVPYETTQFVSGAISPAPLVDGVNVLAVEIHQVTPTSADISFDLELVVEEPRPPERTIVSVLANDPQAAEPGANTFGDPGTFAIRRQGNLNVPIPVSFTLSGTAGNGTDYNFISNRLVIPAGATQTLVSVIPRPDNLVEGTEHVVLTLESPVCPAIYPPPPECYEVGTPSEAVVQIADHPAGTNRPPTVFFYAPQDGDVFTAPADIPLRASAEDPEDGFEITVEFFAGNNRIAVGTFVPSLCPAPYCPYFAATWSNVPPGSYTLTARATDKNGARTISAPARITVQPNGGGERTVVHVVATDAQASELAFNDAANPGQFAIRRTGNLDHPIPVYFSLSGSAQNGTDYHFVSNRVEIPAGATQAVVNIVPIADNLAEGTETVVLAIEPVVCAAVVPTPPECYVVGSPSQATVTISDAPVDTNRPPVAQWIAPSNGSVFTQGMNILLRASASDADGSVVRVEFRRNGILLGSSTGAVGAGTGTNYAYMWSNAPAGSHTLTAVAVDNRNARGTSAPVNITVTSRPRNEAPHVTITVPTNGTVFPPRTDVGIEAVTRDPDGYADTVEFYADNLKIGEQQIVFIQEPVPGEPIYFEFTWTNPPPGQHVLVAATRDNQGARGLSSPVHIFVDGGTNPPPTNITLIATGSVWKYNDTGANLGNAWRWPAFDDSAWPSGPAQLGYGDGDEATVVSYGPEVGNKFITTYFRRSFAVSNAATVARLSAQLLEDDGAAVYLNGTEVFRSNLPDGPVAYNTLATRVAENQVVTFPVPARLLRNGVNVIAVEMHQVHPASSDLSFDFGLRAETGRRRPWLHAPIQREDEIQTSGYRMVVEGDAPATFVVECSADLQQWTPISTNTLWSESMEIIDVDAARGPRRFYRLRTE